VYGTEGRQADASFSSSEEFDNTTTYTGKFICRLRHIYVIHIRWHRFVTKVWFQIRLNPTKHDGIKPRKWSTQLILTNRIWRKSSNMKTSRKTTYNSVTQFLKLSFIIGIKFFNIWIWMSSNYHMVELQFEVLSSFHYVTCYI